MSAKATLIGPLLQGFFVEHLLQHKRVSPQTISSYRDTFRLLLQHAHKKLKTEPAAIKIDAWDAPLILSFLDSLQHSTRRYPLVLSMAHFGSPGTGWNGHSDPGDSREAN